MPTVPTVNSKLLYINNNNVLIINNGTKYLE